MIQYNLPQGGNLERGLWEQGQRLTIGELASAQLGLSFGRETTLGIMGEERRISQAEKEAGTYEDTTFESGLTGNLYKAATMSEEDYKASEWFRKRPDGSAAIEYAPNMTPQRAQILAESYDKRRRTEQLIAQSSDGFFRQATVFGASMLAQLPDPINLIPVGGAVAKGASLGRKVIKGAQAGAISTAIADTVIFPVANARGEDFGFFDVAMDITFGALLGGGLAGAVGKVQNVREVRKATGEIHAASKDFSAALVDAGASHAEASRYTAQIFDTLKAREDGLTTARALRQSIGGDNRAAAGVILDKALMDVMDGRVADVRMYREMLDAGGAFDQVAREIKERRVHLLPHSEVLARIDPDTDIAPLLVRRGMSVEVNGEIKVHGVELKRATGSKAGEGLVKIEIKHPEVTKADVMSLPAIVRDYEPHVDGRGSRTWALFRPDGKKLIIGESAYDGQRVLVTMFVEDGRGTKYRPLSKKRNSARSPGEGFQPNPGDTGGGLSDRPVRSSQSKNPVATDNQDISTDSGKVKNFFYPEEKAQFVAPEAPKSLADEMMDMGIDREGVSTHELEVQRLDAEGLIHPEEVAAMEMAKAAGTRVETWKEAALSIIECVLKISK